MLILRSEKLSKEENIVFGLSTKIGQNPREPFYFNMSKSIGDDEKKVLNNRKLFLNKLNLTQENVVIQKQTHSAIVNIIDAPKQNLEGDALITSTPNIGLAVSTADCNNIYLYDKSKNVIAAVHSGWRGTEKKILKKTLIKLKESFNSESKDLIVFIGPSISKKNYEVGTEVATNFDEKYTEQKGNSDKYLLDLQSGILDTLLEFGIPKSNIEKSSICSFQNNKFQSYRRDGKNSGRALGVLALRPTNEL